MQILYLNVQAVTPSTSNRDGLVCQGVRSKGCFWKDVVGGMLPTLRVLRKKIKLQGIRPLGEDFANFIFSMCSR